MAEIEHFLDPGLKNEPYEMFNDDLNDVTDDTDDDDLDDFLSQLGIRRPDDDDNE